MVHTEDLRAWWARFCAFHAKLEQWGTPVGPLPKEASGLIIARAVAGFRDNFPALQFRDEADSALVKKHLAFTLFVPAGKADRAALAIQKMDKAGWFDSDFLPPDDWDPEIMDGLCELIKSHVRFYRQKAQRLKLCFEKLDELRRNVIGRDEFGMPTRETVDYLRSWLVKRMPGMNFKAASHFCRNTGVWTFGHACAIIDVHILKALEACYMRCDTYESAERSFLRLSALLRIPPLMLDAFVWCAYANNWAPSAADFSNFKPEQPPVC